MHKYHIDENFAAARGSVTVELLARFGGGQYHLPLADALLGVLNSGNFNAVPDGASQGARVRVTFHAAPKSNQTTHLLGRFQLSNIDHAEIQRSATQAQEYVSRVMAEAVRAFDMLLAVSTVDPYKERLRQLLGPGYATASHTHVHDMDGR